MDWRFFKRVRLFPGLWLNLSRRGVSVSAGARGLRATVGKRGTRVTTGLPGTGLSMSHTVGRKSATPIPAEGRRLLEKALRRD